MFQSGEESMNQDSDGNGMKIGRRGRNVTLAKKRKTEIARVVGHESNLRFALLTPGKVS